jgi:hypothetical protein
MKKESVLASAVAVLAVACCAALPSVAWLAGSVTAAVVLGAGAAVVPSSRSPEALLSACGAGGGAQWPLPGWIDVATGRHDRTTTSTGGTFLWLSITPPS